MAVRYVDDGGNNSDGTSWANAYTSINSLIAAEASFLTTSGNIVYFGHDHVCQATNSANLTITGPSSGAPVYFISVTQGTTTYQKGTGSQIDTTEGVYNINFDGSFSVHGLKLVAGDYTQVSADQNEAAYFEACTFISSSTTYAVRSITYGSKFIKDCIIDLSGTTGFVYSMSFGGGALEVYGLSYANVGAKTIIYIINSSEKTVMSGCDFSALNPTSVSLVYATTSGFVTILNCKLPSSYSLGSLANRACSLTLQNSANSGDIPAISYYKNYNSDASATSSIYRTNGQELEGTPVAWLITTASDIGYDFTFDLPWIYGYLDTTGSTNFDVFATNDSADFDDDEVWLEVEYKATSGSGVWTRVDDAIATITTTPAAQDDDTSSTWNGTGPSFTYKQRLRVTATVNQTGQFRARVCVAKPSITAGNYFYIDPKVVIS